MAFIVFGSSGFLGKELVSFLKERGEKVITISRNNEADFKIDITESESFKAIKGVHEDDIIINCASLLPDATKAINDISFIKKLFDTNAIGGVNILNFASAAGIKKVINCSTLSVVNKPWPVPLSTTTTTYPGARHVGYASSKLAQELLMNEVANAGGISLLHLRLSSLYGPAMPWQGILPFLIDKMEKGEDVDLQNAEKNSFDFLHVTDLSRIIYHAAKRNNWEENILNVGSGEEIFLKDLAQTIKLSIGSKSEINNTENIDAILSRAVVDINPIKKLLHTDWQITPLNKGIEQLINSRILQ